MKSLRTFLLTVIAFFIQTCHAEIYKSTMSMKWSIFTPNPRQFSTGEMFSFEKIVGEFFMKELRSSTSFSNQDVYMTTFDVDEQLVNTNAVFTVLRGEMNVLYSGVKQDKFADILSKAITNQKLVPLLDTLIKSDHFQATSTSSKMTFEDIESSTIVSNTTHEILFICLIALVGVLVLTSFSILFKSCCNRRKVEDDTFRNIVHSNTMETEINSPKNSPGKLGARRNIVMDDAESAYAITPVRGDNATDQGTPASQVSSRTEVSNVSQNPLGIMRLNTLNRISLEPEKSKETKSMYQITLHESDDEESAYEK